MKIPGCQWCWGSWCGLGWLVHRRWQSPEQNWGLVLWGGSAEKRCKLNSLHGISSQDFHLAFITGQRCFKLCSLKIFLNYHLLQTPSSVYSSIIGNNSCANLKPEHLDYDFNTTKYDIRFLIANTAQLKLFQNLEAFFVFIVTTDHMIIG